eukprot:11191873-Lingulodinium_polyedra.AAC.1
MDRELNAAKSRLWANAQTLRRWLAAKGGGGPAATTFKGRAHPRRGGPLWAFGQAPGALPCQ